MIEKLKFMIDESENNPKLKAILLKVAAMPESEQDAMLQLMELLIQSMKVQP